MTKVEPWMREAAKAIAEMNQSDLWQHYYRHGAIHPSEADRMVYDHLARVIADHVPVETRDVPTPE